jgi:hypothetical protein
MVGLALGVLGCILYFLSNLFHQYQDKQRKIFPWVYIIMRVLTYVTFFTGAILLISSFF